MPIPSLYAQRLFTCACVVALSPACLAGHPAWSPARLNHPGCPGTSAPTRAPPFLPPASSLVLCLSRLHTCYTHTRILENNYSQLFTTIHNYSQHLLNTIAYYWIRLCLLKIFCVLIKKHVHWNTEIQRPVHYQFSPVQICLPTDA